MFGLGVEPEVVMDGISMPLGIWESSWSSALRHGRQIDRSARGCVKPREVVAVAFPGTPFLFTYEFCSPPLPLLTLD